MGIAGERFGKLYLMWKNKSLSLTQKIALYERGVISVLLYGCESWILDDKLQKIIRGWNSRCLHRITDRSYRDECVEPSLDILARAKPRRMKFLGHVLRSDNNYLAKQVLLADGERQMKEMNRYEEGAILSEAPYHRSLKKLQELAQDRPRWKKMAYEVKCGSVASLAD